MGVAFLSDELFAKTLIPKAYMTLALPVVGLAFGGQPLIGYTYGAKDKERMQRVIAFALKAVVGTSAVLAAVLAILPIWFGYTGVIAAQLAADVVTVIIAAGLYRACLSA